LVEFTLVFPVLILVAMGTVDFTYMLFEWNQASKAAYRGARFAAISDPASANITNPTYNVPDLGKVCFVVSTGVSTGLCPTVDVTCAPPVNAGLCPNYSATAFNAIVAQMQQVFPRLLPQHVEIQYQTTGLGFVGRPGGLPMTVTVRLHCIQHQFYFLASLMSWVFTPTAGCPAGQVGPPIPTFASTLSSEDLATN